MTVFERAESREASSDVAEPVSGMSFSSSLTDVSTPVTVLPAFVSLLSAEAFFFDFDDLLNGFLLFS